MTVNTSKSVNKIFTIPNILSFIRLAMIPLICVVYIGKTNGLITALLVLLSGLTDIADGFIARHYNMVSNFGKALDPLADKLTQLAVLICLVIYFPRMIYLVVLMAIKEITTGVMSLVVTKRTKEVHGAVWHGKVTTFLLYAIMFIHLIWYKIPPIFSDSLIFLCFGFMVLSFTLYTIRNIQYLYKK